MSDSEPHESSGRTQGSACKKKFRVNRGCTFCGTCVFECASGAVSIGIEGAFIDEKKCIGCGVCLDNCASEAITEWNGNE